MESQVLSPCYRKEDGIALLLSAFNKSYVYIDLRWRSKPINPRQANPLWEVGSDDSIFGGLKKLHENRHNWQISRQMQSHAVVLQSQEPIREF